MRWIFLMMLFFVSYILHAQIITLYAGGALAPGIDGIGDGLHADSATLYFSGPLYFDHFGNFYITEGYSNRIRKIDTNGIIHLYAGNGTAGYSGDGGVADTSEIQPIGVVSDSAGNVYIADNGNNRLRKVNNITNIITTVAGDGLNTSHDDSGIATAIELSPAEICIDKRGNIYMTSDDYVLKLNVAGIITRFAGVGVLGSTGDGGPALSAEVCGTNIIMDDTGNIYLTENGIGAERIRKIDTNGIVTTIAGNGSYLYNGDSLPALVCNIDPKQTVFDNSGNLIFGDNYNNIVRKMNAAGIIYTIAGTTVAGYSGDGGLADTAKLDEPGGEAVDKCGNIYIAQAYPSVIRKISYPVPLIHIGCFGKDTVCAGNPVTYWSDVSGGNNLVYHWYINGTIRGTTRSYAYTPLNGDSIRCEVISNTSCYGIDSSTSNTIHMVVMPWLTPTITITASPTVAAVGSVVTVTASFSGVGGTYSINWYDNGSPLGSSTTGSITYTKSSDTDHITATIVPAAAYPDCYDSASSVTLVVTNTTGVTSPSTLERAGVKLYPNPAGDVVYVGGITGTYSYKLMNTIGATMLTGTASPANNAIPLTNLPRGIYLLALTDEDGCRVVKVLNHDLKD